MMTSDPQPLLDYWFSESKIDNLRGIDGGLSGATLWSFNAAEFRWGLKQHDAGYPRERMAEIDNVLRLARGNARLCLPQPRQVSPQQTPGSSDGWCVFQGRVWSCWKWCEGQSPGPAQLNASLVLDMVRWIGDFHQTVRPLAKRFAGAPTIIDRYRRLVQQAQILTPVLGTDLNLPQPTLRSNTIGNSAFDAALDRARLVLKSKWRQTAGEFIRQASDWQVRPLRLQYVLRDVHPGNAIVHDRRLRTMIDLDAIRIDTPATDLARLLGDPRVRKLFSSSNPNEYESFTELCLQTYRSPQPLTPEEEVVFHWLMTVNPLINLANWFIWLAVDRQDFRSATPQAFERLGEWTELAI